MTPSELLALIRELAETHSSFEGVYSDIDEGSRRTWEYVLDLINDNPTHAAPHAGGFFMPTRRKEPR